MAYDGMAGEVVNTAVRQRARLRSGERRTASMIVLTLLGGLGLLLALTVGSTDPNAVPTCNGQPMGQQDICDIYSSSGDGGSFTYQQMLDRQQSQSTRWRVIGFGVAGACVLLAVPVAQNLNPSKPWGRALDTSCPRCGKRSLEERRTTYNVTRHRVTRSYSGIVTLCTPECGYATVRQR